MSPPLTFSGPWRAMADHAGGLPALATALTAALKMTRPLHTATLQHWIRGERTPSETKQHAINGWATRRGLVGPFQKEEG